MRNDSCFWAINALVSALVAAVFLVLLLCGQLMPAGPGIWITTAVSALLLLALILRGPYRELFGGAGAYPPQGAAQATAPAQPACCFHRFCCLRWLGAIAGAAAAVGFGAAYLSAAEMSVAALVFFFLAVFAFTFALVALVGYAACRCATVR